MHIELSRTPVLALERGGNSGGGINGDIGVVTNTMAARETANSAAGLSAQTGAAETASTAKQTESGAARESSRKVAVNLSKISAGALALQVARTSGRSSVEVS